MDEKQLAEIEARCQAATPGPWRWELNLKNKHVNLCGGDPRKGFGAYDLTVMDFVRWGMRGAQPRFRDERDIMHDASTMGREVEGREHHAEWFQDVAHRDAAFIAHARADVPALAAALREAWGKLLIADGATMLATGLGLDTHSLVTDLAHETMGKLIAKEKECAAAEARALAAEKAAGEMRAALEAARDALIHGDIETAPNGRLCYEADDIKSAGDAILAALAEGGAANG